MIIQNNQDIPLELCATVFKCYFMQPLSWWFRHRYMKKSAITQFNQQGIVFYSVGDQQAEVRPYLQDAVSRLETAIFDCCTALQDVLHQDWPWPVDRGVPCYHGEAQTLCACGNKAARVTVCNGDIDPPADET